MLLPELQITSFCGQKNPLYEIDFYDLNKNIKVGSYVPGLYICSGKYIIPVIES